MADIGSSAVRDAASLAGVDRPPDIVFGGIYKAGTTFLRGYFTQHPQITWTRRASFFQESAYSCPATAYPPSPPEDARCFIDMFEALTLGHIFSRESDWARTYLLPGASLAEAGVTLNQEEVARRVKETLPEARILLVLRNQVDWMRSAYAHHLELLPRSHNAFSDFLATPMGKLVANASQFDRIVAAYQEQFGRDGVGVVLLEQLQADQQATLTGLCRFFGVDEAPYVPADGDRNAGKKTAVGHAVRIAARWGLGDFAARLPAPFRTPSRRAAEMIFRGDLISVREKDLIRAFCASSNARTATLTGLDLGRFGYPL